MKRLGALDAIVAIVLFLATWKLAWKMELWRGGISLLAFTVLFLCPAVIVAVAWSVIRVSRILRKISDTSWRTHVAMVPGLSGTYLSKLFTKPLLLSLLPWTALLFAVGGYAMRLAIDPEVVIPGPVMQSATYFFRADYPAVIAAFVRIITIMALVPLAVLFFIAYLVARSCRTRFNGAVVVIGIFGCLAVPTLLGWGIRKFTYMFYPIKDRNFTPLNLAPQHRLPFGFPAEIYLAATVAVFSLFAVAAWWRWRCAVRAFATLP